MINLNGLEDFLINESKINKDFIKDFFGIQKNKAHEKYKPFTIDLDDIAFWLDAKKGNLKDTLIKNYLNKFDYIIIICAFVNLKIVKHNLGLIMKILNQDYIVQNIEKII